MRTDTEIEENLTDAGCCENEIKAIMDCISSGDIIGAKKLIAASRKKLLAGIHEMQLCVDRLDYLIWQMDSSTVIDDGSELF